MAEAPGESGLGHDQKAQRTGGERSQTTRRQRHPPDPQKTHRHVRDVLAREEDRGAVESVQTHLQHYARSHRCVRVESSLQGLRVRTVVSCLTQIIRLEITCECFSVLVRLFGADDFLPMFTYVLVQCDMPQLDTEIMYMMELIDPPLLHGEGMFTCFYTNTFKLN